MPDDLVRRLDYSTDGVRRSLEASLERLGLGRWPDPARPRTPPSTTALLQRTCSPAPGHSRTLARPRVSPCRWAALQFPLRHPAVAAVVVGLSSPGPVASATAWLADPIDDEIWENLDAIAERNP